MRQARDPMLSSTPATFSIRKKTCCTVVGVAWSDRRLPTFFRAFLMLSSLLGAYKIHISPVPQTSVCQAVVANVALPSTYLQPTRIAADKSERVCFGSLADMSQRKEGFSPSGFASPGFPRFALIKALRDSPGFAFKEVMPSASGAVTCRSCVFLPTIMSSGIGFECRL